MARQRLCDCDVCRSCDTRLAVLWAPLNHPKPDVSIFIQKIGGGAAPEGYAAMNGSYTLAEGWTEDQCLEAAIRELSMIHYFTDERHPYMLDFPTFNIAQRASFAIFLEPWQRAELTHDLADCILAIENGALFH